MLVHELSEHVDWKAVAHCDRGFVAVGIPDTLDGSEVVLYRDWEPNQLDLASRGDVHLWTRNIVRASFLHGIDGFRILSSQTRIVSDVRRRMHGWLSAAQVPSRYHLPISSSGRPSYTPSLMHFASVMGNTLVFTIRSLVNLTEFIVQHHIDLETLKEEKVCVYEQSCRPDQQTYLVPDAMFISKIGDFKLMPNGAWVSNGSHVGGCYNNSIYSNVSMPDDDKTTYYYNRDAILISHFVLRQSGELRFTNGETLTPGGKVRAVHPTPDGKMVFVAADRRVKVFRKEEFKYSLDKEFDWGISTPKNFALSGDGLTASLLTKNSLVVWDLE